MVNWWEMPGLDMDSDESLLALISIIGETPRDLLGAAGDQEGILRL
jgi:hypothetical protein